MADILNLSKFQETLQAETGIDPSSRLGLITAKTEAIMGQIENFETLGDFAKLEGSPGAIVESYTILNNAFRALKDLNEPTKIPENLKGLSTSADPIDIAEFEGEEDIIL